MLTIILSVIALAILAVLLIAAFRPKTFRVERTASIQAPPEKIFPWIDDLHRNAQWLPYYRKDPAMTIQYQGPQQGVGAVCEFAGNKDVGTGRVTITDTAPPRQVRMRLQMFKPFAADNSVEFRLVPRGGATDVTWAMQGAQPYIGRVMCLFFNLDKMVGADFNAGLSNLKALAEK